MAQKTCQQCGASFSCTGDSDCWCESVQILRKDMIEIMGRYTDCICPDCLRKFESE